MTMVDALVAEVLASKAERSRGKAASPFVSALQAARTLAESLSAIPDDAPEAQHPSYGVTRALAYTMVDMLEEMSTDNVSAPTTSRSQRRMRW